MNRSIAAMMTPAQYRRGVIGQSFKIVRCRPWWPQAGSPHYLMCLDGLLTANKVVREFEFTPLRHRVLIRLRFAQK